MLPDQLALPRFVSAFTLPLPDTVGTVRQNAEAVGNAIVDVLSRGSASISPTSLGHTISIGFLSTRRKPDLIVPEHTESGLTESITLWMKYPGALASKN